jgi:WD40 repeat protein
MPDVFISYSRRDGEFSRKLHQKFSELGKDVWMDWEDIPLTSDWWEEIRKGIETSDNFILVMSPDSIGSPVCQLEIDHALKFNKRIIPLFHRDPLFDTALTGIVERVQSDKNLNKMTEQFNILAVYGTNRDTLSKLNWVFFKPEDEFDEKFVVLIKAVDDDLTHIRQHTRLLARALEWDGHQRNISFIISGDELNAAETWLASAANKAPAPVELHRMYLAQSRKVENSRKRLLRGLQVASGVFGVLVLLALVGIALAVNRANYAQQQAALAETERAVAIDYAATATVAQGEALIQQKAAQQDAAIALTAEQAAEDRANIAGTEVADARIEAQGYSTQVAVIGSTLTPVPPTLTAVAIDVQQQQLRAELLRLGGEANDQLNRSDSNPELAALLAIRSLQLGYTDNADKALTRALALFSTERILGDGDTNNPMYASEFSPDGNHAATGDENGMVIIWEVLTGIKVHEIALNSSVLSLAYSSDGNNLAAGLRNGTFVLLSSSTGREIKRIERPDQGAAWGVSFSPDGNWLGLGWENGLVMLANWRTNERREIYDGDWTAFATSFSPDGRYFAANNDWQLHIWDFATGDHVRQITTVIGIYDLQFSPDGKTIVTGHVNAAVQQYDVATGELLREFNGHTGLVNSVDFSADGTLLATAGEDGAVKLWDVPTGTNIATLHGHTAEVYWVAISPDGRYILSASLDGTTRVWNYNDVIDEGDAARLLRETNEIVTIAYSPDGRYIATGANNQIRLWDAQTGVQITTRNHLFAVTSVTFSSDSTMLATTGDDAVVYIWSAPDFERIALLAPPEDKKRKINAFDFSPDGKRGVGGTDSDDAYVWDMATGEILVTFAPHTHWVQGADWSPDGQLIATGAFDSLVYIWDANTGEVRHTLQGHSDRVLGVAWSPDGRYVASSSEDNTVRIWDANTGETLQILAGHTFWVKSVAWSPDGTKLVSTSLDQTARVWDTTTWQTVRVYQGHAGTVNDAAFSPDGKLIVTGSADHTALIWDTDYHDLIDYACGRLVRDLTVDEREIYQLNKLPTCLPG